MPKLKKATFEQLSEGQHSARLTRIIDIGTQTITFTDKKTKKEKTFKASQIQFGFQAVDEKKENGDAMMAYTSFGNSDGPTSKLVKTLTAWLGVKSLSEDFDLDDLLGKEAIITVIHNDKGYATIANIGGIPKGHKVAKATEPIVSLYLDEENWNADVFENELSDFEKTKVMESEEYPLLTAPKAKADKTATKAGKKK
jgi:hypothetical protein